MNDALSVHAFQLELERLVRRGRQLRDGLAIDSSTEDAAAVRSWQRDCAELVSRLSGGSKAHWLARAYSEAFLVRSASGRVLEQVAAREIAARILAVLDRAAASLSQLDAEGSTPSAPVPPRFAFVHDVELRPVLERAYVDGRLALDERRFGVALMTSCSILEAIVTDALENARRNAASDDEQEPSGPIASWPFEARAARAEALGLIRRGCARLPPIAWKYREIDLTDDAGVSEREARLAVQVLNVVMRDLEPGRK
jgi:hypothetical protein